MSLLALLFMFGLVFYISIALHELGHFVAFILNKIAVRVLNIAPFSFIFNGSRWTVRLNRNGSGVAGIVIPNLTVVPNEAAFKKMQRGYANAILGGSMVSFLLIIIGIGLFWMKGYLGAFGSMLIIINLVILLGCFIKQDNVFGDFPAYQAYKEDDFFAALMMYQYAIFAVDYEIVRKNNRYLKDVLFKGLIPRINNKQTDLLTVSCVSTFIGEYLIGIADKLPETIENYIEYYYEYYETILSNQTIEANKELLLYITYYFQKQGLTHRSIELYENFIQKLPTTEVFNYWKIQSEQIILGKDHTSYLLDKENIKPNLSYSIFKKIDGFYHDELILNQL